MKVPNTHGSFCHCPPCNVISQVVPMFLSISVGHFIISGGSSSATSVTSGSTAETKPSSAVLCPPGPCHAYSPIESPDSSKRRSFVSLGNNSSNSKSSSNFTGSTKSSQRSQEPGGTSNLGPPLQHTVQPQVYNIQGHYFF
jgi:hypothetical protein